MDNWQAWAGAVFAFIMMVVGFNYKRDKKRDDDEAREFQKFKLEMTERIVRIEAEIMTEREVREVLQEFFQPFLSSLHDINNKTDSIQKDVNDVKIRLASIPKRSTDHD
jgi:Na+-driven multidrug efflux pump